MYLVYKHFNFIRAPGHLDQLSLFIVTLRNTNLTVVFELNLEFKQIEKNNISESIL